MENDWNVASIFGFKFLLGPSQFGIVSDQKKFREHLKESVSFTINEYLRVAYSDVPGLTQLHDRINVKIEDNYKINGYVELDGTNINIGINFGTILSLFDLFYTAVSYRDFHEAYGSEGRFVVKRNENANRFFDYSHLKDLNDREFVFNFVSEIPTTPERSFLAEIYTTLSIWFIVSHEVGHFTRGHTHYRKAIARNQKEKLRFAEFSENADIISDFERQAMEHGADQAGVSNLFFPFLRIAEHITSQIPKKEYHNHLEIMRILFGAIGTVSLIFEKASIESNRVMEKYPSPICRFLNTMVRCIQNYQFSGSSIPKFMNPILIKAGYESYFKHYDKEKNWNEIEIIIKNTFFDLKQISGLLGIHKFMDFQELKQDVLSGQVFNFSDNTKRLSPVGLELNKYLLHDRDTFIDKLLPFSKMATPEWYDNNESQYGHNGFRFEPEDFRGV